MLLREPLETKTFRAATLPRARVYCVIDQQAGIDPHARVHAAYELF
jgi:hypothetical protein